MIPDPIYLLLKLKRKLKGQFHTFRHRNNLTRDGISQFLANPSVSKEQLKSLQTGSLKILRVLSVGIIFFVFLTVGTQRVGPVKGQESPVPEARPALLSGSSPPPKITAKSAYLIDRKSGFVLYDKNSFQGSPAASTVKLATAMVALDNFDLDEVVRVPSSCAFRRGESLIGLVPGEKITVRDLLRGMLISSGSDAACTLAAYYRDGSARFIEEMNILADSLGLKETQFTSSSGLSGDNYSTARDLTFLAKEALSEQTIRQIVKTRKIAISSVDKKRWHELVNTNELLGSMPGVLGVKTGYTLKANGVLVFYLKRGKKELLGTVMGSDDRFGDAKKLLNWALSSFLFP